MICLPSFLLGGAGIYRIGIGWLVLWLLIIIGYFGFAEIRVMCSHCPHYAEADRWLKCWANYGAPKIWRYRPGPMTLWEKAVFIGGFIMVWGYPLGFLLYGSQWLLFATYVVSTIGFFLTLRTFLCSQCMNFACPLNRVDEKVRDLFFKRNPEVGKAWGVDTNEQTKGASPMD